MSGALCSFALLITFHCLSSFVEISLVRLFFVRVGLMIKRSNVHWVCLNLKVSSLYVWSMKNGSERVGKRSCQVEEERD